MPGLGQGFGQIMALAKNDWIPRYAGNEGCIIFMSETPTSPPPKRGRNKKVSPLLKWVRNSSMNRSPRLLY